MIKLPRLTQKQQKVLTALGEVICEIYTDVEGIYTADPHLVPEARKLEEISYEEMLELASCGTKVIHPRAVEMAERYGVPILILSSFNESSGTLIHREATDDYARAFG